MTTPDASAELPFLRLYCDQADCGLPIVIPTDKADSVSVKRDVQTGEVTAVVRKDLLPVRLLGELFCERPDCCMGTASLTTTRPEAIALLQRVATGARFDMGFTDGDGFVEYGPDGEPSAI